MRIDIEVNGRVIALDSKQFIKHFKMDEFTPDWFDAKSNMHPPFLVKQIEDKNSKDMGSVLVAQRSFEAGKPVLKYLGKKTIDAVETDNDYEMFLEINATGQKVILDALKKSGLARFVAHASHAPLTTGAATANLMQFPYKDEMWLIACCDINEGDWLTMDYRERWWEARIDRFPFGPTPFTRQGRCLPRVTHSEEQKQYFSLQCELEVQKRILNLENMGKFEKELFDLKDWLKVTFPTLHWVSLDIDSPVFVVLKDKPQQQEKLAFFNKRYAEQIPLTPHTITNALGERPKFVIEFPRMDRSQYMQYLRQAILFNKTAFSSKVLIQFSGLFDNPKANYLKNNEQCIRLMACR